MTCCEISDSKGLTFCSYTHTHTHTHTLVSLTHTNIPLPNHMDSSNDNDSVGLLSVKLIWLRSSSSDCGFHGQLFVMLLHIQTIVYTRLQTALIFHNKISPLVFQSALALGQEFVTLLDKVSSWGARSAQQLPAQRGTVQTSIILLMRAPIQKKPFPASVCANMFSAQIKQTRLWNVIVSLHFL